MARLIVVAALVLATASACGGGSSGSGTGASEVRHVAPFTAVELAGGTSVTVTVGEPRRVVVHADDNLIDHVTTRVVAKRLIVGNTGSFTTSSPMRVDVRVPRLDALVLSGGGLLQASDVSARVLRVTHSGGGVVQARGSVGTLSVLLSGGGTAELAALVARDARVELTGAGTVLVDTTNSLRAVLSGSGSIVYAGSPPHVSSRVTGTGTISPARS